MKKTNLVDVLIKSLFQKGPCISIYLRDSSQMDASLEKIRTLFLNDNKIDIFDFLTQPIKKFNFQQKNLTQQPIAVFLSPYNSFWVELPFVTKDIHVAADTFHVKPILKWQQREKPFYLLRIIDSTASLYLCGLMGMQFEKKFNVKKIANKNQTDLFDLNKKIHEYMKNKKTPMIVVSDNVILTKNFLDICTYEKCIEDTFPAHPLMIQDHKKSILYLEEYYALEEKKLLNQYWEAKPRGQTSSIVHEILQRALLGQIKHLFINENTNIWGEINHTKGTLQYHEKQLNTKDDDILDDLAQIVLSFQGEVTVLNSQLMPDQRAAVAIFKHRDPTTRRKPVSLPVLKLQNVS
ncbi:hypothetical protein K2X05_00360 [bacterium]|nr:hypothetical protein [bacterium]